MVTQMWSLQLSILSGVSASFSHPKPLMFTAFILLILQDSTELRKFISHKSCIKLTQMYELFVGKTNRNNVQAVYSGGKLASFSTIVIGCGLFSDLIYHTERQRWLKKARYVGEIKFTNCDFVTYITQQLLQYDIGAQIQYTVNVVHLAPYSFQCFFTERRFCQIKYINKCHSFMNKNRHIQIYANLNPR